MDDGERIASVRIDPSSVTVPVGQTVLLTVEVTDQAGRTVTDPQVTWLASPADVATVDAGGRVTGVAPGAATVTARVGGVTGTASVTVEAPDLAVTTPGLPSGVSGETYEARLEATGGVPPYAWTLAGGELPPGLTLESDGRVAGTPAAAGEWTLGVEVTSSDGQSATAEIDLTVVDPLAVATADLPEATTAVPYSAELRASGGMPPYSWEHLEGELPQGVTLSTDGTVSGTPTRAGDFSFSVRVTDVGARTAQAVVRLTVGGEPLPLAITTSSLPEAVRGRPYSAALRATGGTGDLSWALQSGSLPDGLEVIDVGTILGVPTGTDTATFTVRVSGGLDAATRSLTLEVRADTLLGIVTSALPPARVGRSYEATLTAAGGEPPYAWSLASGFVPSGLRLESDGVVGGVPTQPGEATFTVRVSSADGQTATGVLEIDVESLEDSSPEGYDLTVLAVGGIPDPIRPHVNAAVARWERTVVGDLEDLSIPPDAFQSASCGGFGNDLNGLDVEDLAVLVNIASIDGRGRVLGRAGPCGVREDGTPFAGILTLDSDDLEPLVGTRTLTDLIFHEIGHIVGIGTLWDDGSLLEGAGTADPRYVGPGGIEQYAALGGSGSVPVANTGGSGTRDAHWREDVFGPEIMTGYAEPVGTPMPLSVLTIGSLVDLGYVVDLAEADPFDLPDPTAPAPVPSAGSTGFDLVLDESVVIVRRDGSHGVGRR